MLKNVSGQKPVNNQD